MPKKRQSGKPIPSSSDSDSGPDDRTPLKKAKTSEQPGLSKGGNADQWKIGRERYIKLTEFKGKHYVDIRDYYMADNGDLRPGRKGIMLQMEQWQQLKNLIPEVDAAIKRRV